MKKQKKCYQRECGGDMNQAHGMVYERCWEEEAEGTCDVILFQLKPLKI